VKAGGANRFEREVGHFADAVRGISPLVVNGHDGARAVELCTLSLSAKILTSILLNVLGFRPFDKFLSLYAGISLAYIVYSRREQFPPAQSIL